MVRAAIANWRQAPFNRWAFHHVRELLPTAPVPCDGAHARELPHGAPVDLEGIVFQRHGGGRTSVAAMLDATQTDAFVVLRHGRIVAEQYRNGMSVHSPHILMSVSKSLTAIVAAVLEARGVLDPQAPVTGYLPETAGSAFDGASVRHLLDMRTGVRFDEEYLAGGGPFIDYRIAMGWNLAAPGASLTDLRGSQPVQRRACTLHLGLVRDADRLTIDLDRAGLCIQSVDGAAHLGSARARQALDLLGDEQVRSVPVPFDRQRRTSARQDLQGQFGQAREVRHPVADGPVQTKCDKTDSRHHSNHGDDDEGQPKSKTHLLLLWTSAGFGSLGWDQDERPALTPDACRKPTPPDSSRIGRFALVLLFVRETST